MENRPTPRMHAPETATAGPLGLVLAALLLLPLFLFPAGRALAAPLRVALLVESGAPDHGAADLLRKGLAEAAAETGAQAEIIVADPDRVDQTAVFREAASGHDLVIVAEGRLHEILRDNAANFRRVHFGCIDTGVRAKNIMSVTFEDQQACFLAGAAAALMAGPGERLGWLVSEKTPMLDTMLAGFVEGAQVSRPDIRIVVAEESGFSDRATAAARIRALAADNVKAVVVACGYASPAAFAAAAATGKNGLLAVGVGDDQSALAPDNVPFSVVKRFDRAVREIVASAASGHFRGKEILVYDLANGGVDLALSGRFAREKRFPASLERRVAELRRELAAGNIRLRDLRNPTLCDCLD